MATIEKIRTAEDATSTGGPADLAALNAITVTLTQLLIATQVLAQLTEDTRWDASARRDVLDRELGVSQPVVEAIDARLLALRKWEDLHDPGRMIDQLHLLDAASLARLFETEHGTGFNDTSFGELVEFVSELPW